MTYTGLVRNKLFGIILGILLAFHSFGQRSAGEICPLPIGSNVPSALVKDTSDHPVSLDELIEKKQAIIVFYRGEWCPYCKKHLSALAEKEEEIKELGFQIIGISPDLPDYTHQLQQKKAIQYKLYSDAEMNAAKAFGINFTVDEETLKKYSGYGIDLEANSGQDHHQLPVPAIFIIENGKIKYSYANPNYKKRLSPEVLIAMLKAD